LISSAFLVKFLGYQNNGEMKKLRIEKRLEYLDDLTGLYNRRYFRERILEEKRKADRQSSSFALMMVDLDNFKPINDTYGHLTGDRVLNQVGRLIKESLRSSDILCRYAGDEFVVILPESGEEEVIRVSERVKETFAQADWKDEKEESIQPVTCSLGYAFYSEKGSDLNQLIGWADQALYVVKRRGGNGYFGGKELPEESTGRPLSTTPHIVGREKEMRQLRSLIQGDHTKEGKFVLIHGEAGVGKTRLVRELQGALERKGGVILTGSCHEETHSIPYYPFREAFKHFFEDVGVQSALRGESLLENLPEYSQRELTRILPGLKEMEPTELERSPDPYRLFESVLLLLRSEMAPWRQSSCVEPIELKKQKWRLVSNSLQVL
jgi:diguanylate cyclase (GGDEF)-like protein